MKKSCVEDLALFGAPPAFQKIIPVGQLNLPVWDRFEASFRDVFSRQYYTNQGPLVDELESRLQEFLGVNHVICMTNATIALIVAAKALALTGKVICPAFTFIASAQSISWAGLEPVFCDVDPETHQLSIEHTISLIDEDVSAILGVHLWGNPCNPVALQKIAQERNVKLYFDAAHAFGCSFSGVKAGNFGLLEVFSFHATKVLNAAEGSCVCTNDDLLAARLRNIRSSYGAGPPIEIPVTGNGRMSEAQAALALLSLEDYPGNQERNRNYSDLYYTLLNDVPGIRILRPDLNDTSNYQYVVLEIISQEFGFSRDLLLEILNAENIAARKYFSPGAHKSVPYCHDLPQYAYALPDTDRLCGNILQLPSGQHIERDDIKFFCAIVRFAHENAVKINKLAEQSISTGAESS